MYSRNFLNSKVQNGVSSNWRTDWKMFSGVSYASVVKRKNKIPFQDNSFKLVGKNKQATQLKGVQTDTKRVEVRDRVPSRPPLTKRSDVTSTCKRIILSG